GWAALEISNWGAQSMNEQTGYVPPAEEYERWLNQPVAPAILAADKLFRVQLPELLKTHPGQWVAYSSSACLGFHASGDILYNECLKKGYEPEQFTMYFITGGLLESDDLVV